MLSKAVLMKQWCEEEVMCVDPLLSGLFQNLTHGEYMVTCRRIISKATLVKGPSVCWLWALVFHTKRSIGPYMQYWESLSRSNWRSLWGLPFCVLHRAQLGSNHWAYLRPSYILKRSWCIHIVKSSPPDLNSSAGNPSTTHRFVFFKREISIRTST